MRIGHGLAGPVCRPVVTAVVRNAWTTSLLPGCHQDSKASSAEAPKASHKPSPHNSLSALPPQELKELIGSYQTLRESGRGAAICSTIIETARQCNLDKDIAFPDADCKDLTLDERDGVVGQAYSK